MHGANLFCYLRSCKATLYDEMQFLELVPKLGSSFDNIRVTACLTPSKTFRPTKVKIN